MDTSQAFPFVAAGREAELRRLQRHLNRAIHGEAQVAFVAGDSGIGKSFLVQEVCRRARRANANLLVAWGQCNNLSGLGESYLPFKQGLAELTGDTASVARQNLIDEGNERGLQDLGSKTVETIIELGPDLLGFFVPPLGLLARVASFGVKHAGWVERLERLAQNPPVQDDIEPEHLFEQFSRVLMSLAEREPIVLVLDDLHWADSGTRALLFYLVRRLHEIKRLPFLLVGTVRSADPGINGTPGMVRGQISLKDVMAESQRYWGEVVIDLTPTIVEENRGRDFINTLLEPAKFQVDDRFRETLFLRTEGHPLFATEILHWLQEQQILIKGPDERWIAVREITLDELPARVEAVIERRVDQIDSADLRETLDYARVQGPSFIAEVVAAAQGLDGRQLAQRLGRDLEQRFELVAFEGLTIVGSHRLHRYRFRHALYQHYVYHELSVLEQEMLHLATGYAFEKVYGDVSFEVAAEIARHFDRAGELARSISYYKIAADEARRTFANEEALRLYSRALEITQPEGASLLRFDLLAERRRIYRLQEAASAELQDLEEMLKIAISSGARSKDVEARLWKASYFTIHGDYPAAEREAGEALSLAQQLHDSVLMSRCLTRVANSLRWQGETEDAISTANSAMRILHESNDQGAKVDCLINLGLLYDDVGQPEEAQKHLEDALSLVREIGDLKGECNIQYLLGSAYYSQGEYTDGRAHAEAALAIAKMIGSPRSEAESLLRIAYYHVDLGDYETALSYYNQSRVIQRVTGDRRGEAVSLLNEGLVLAELGRNDAARQRLDQALDLGRQLHGIRTQATALNYLGLVFEGLQKPTDAGQAYAEALRFRQQIGEEARAIDCVGGLLRLATKQGDAATMRRLVQEALTWFKDRGPDGVEYPIRVFVACIQALQTLEEHVQARAVLHVAYRLLMERADKITEPELRRSYLRRVPFNRELIELWQSGIGGR